MDPGKTVIKGDQIMAEEIKCSCGSANVAIFPCSGASNVGQLSNHIAVELTEKGTGKMMCTAGVGGLVSGLVKSAEGSDRVIAIDGCPLNCAKKCLENAGVQIDKHILLTKDLDIKKNKDLKIEDDLLNETMEKIAKIL